jgi:hypothetical protein
MKYMIIGKSLEKSSKNNESVLLFLLLHRFVTRDVIEAQVRSEFTSQKIQIERKHDVEPIDLVSQGLSIPEHPAV